MLRRSIGDFRAEEVEWVLERAEQHRSGSATVTSRTGTIVGLAFLETSLRTRTGFAAAAGRLGATPVEVVDVRSSAISMPESLADTLRTLAGYSSVLVARVNEELYVPAGVTTPVLSGGDRGAAAEHPSQALIDLFALLKAGRPIGDLRIGIVGDLRMRTVRSLLLLLSRYVPEALVLISEPALLDGFELPTPLKDIATYGALHDATDVDALYVAGVPHQAIGEEGRTRLRVTTSFLDQLKPAASVLSPLPVIDEMERDAVDHPRVRMFEQSDDGLFVRMALLELLLGARLP